MGFELIGLSSLFLSLSSYHPILLYFTIIHLFIHFLAFAITCFVLSFLSLGMVIFHTLMHRGLSYHSVDSILWYWLRDFSLRGYLMGGGFMCSLVIGESLFIPYIFSVEFDLLMIRVVCALFRKKKNKKKERKNKDKRNKNWYVCIWYLIPLGTYVIFWGLFIGYIHHWGFMWENKTKERKKIKIDMFVYDILLH